MGKGVKWGFCSACSLKSTQCHVPFAALQEWTWTKDWVAPSQNKNIANIWTLSSHKHLSSVCDTCVCLYVYMDAFMCMCAAVWICVCMCAYIYGSVCIYACTHAYVCMCVYMCICTCVNVYTRVYACVCICMHVYMSVFYIHVHKHICIYMCLCMYCCVCMHGCMHASMHNETSQWYDNITCFLMLRSFLCMQMYM